MDKEQKVKVITNIIKNTNGIYFNMKADVFKEAIIELKTPSEIIDERIDKLSLEILNAISD